MGNVTELRVVLTVEDFDQALAFYRDAMGLEQVADWSSGTGPGPARLRPRGRRRTGATAGRRGRVPALGRRRRTRWRRPHGPSASAAPRSPDARRRPEPPAPRSPGSRTLR